MNENGIIYNRLKKNLKKLAKPLKNMEFSAYRIYEKDIPEFPYLVDIYGNYCFIYEKGKFLESGDAEEQLKHETHKKELSSAITEILDIPAKNIIFKTRQKQKGKNQYEKIAKQNKFTEVQEYGMKFKINLFDYLDSGLFLDHRPLRKIILESSQEKTVLNLFSYTGSISVAAALGGAQKVTTVDMSKTYLDWAQDNFKLNELSTSQHDFIQADILEYCKKLKGKFDIIILDPPSFSNSKRMEKSFNIQDDHSFLINTLMKNLNLGGVLYFSNNYTKFKLDEELTKLFEIKEITYKTIPAEFRNKKIHKCFEIKKSS